MVILDKNQVKDLIKLYDLKDAKQAQEVIKDLFKDVIQGMLESELENELGYSKHDYRNKATSNSRNGKYSKNVRSTLGEFEIDVPRDRDGEYEPIAVKKGQKDVSSIEDQVLSMYGRGMSTRDISNHLEEIYGINASAGMISKITDKIMPIIKEWQRRPLQSIYPIMYMDAVHFKIRSDSVIKSKAVYLAVAIDANGMKDVLGIWVGENETSKFWLTVLNDMKNRGLEDVLISCVDGLKGFKEAIQAVFPKTELQRCIVHQVRYCCKFVNYKDRKEFCRDMKEIYTAPSEELALESLIAFSEKWDKKYPYATKSWHNNWEDLSAFFKYPEEIRRLVYTTNPIESLNASIRKPTKSKSVFPTDDAVIKSVYLAVSDKIKKWTLRMRDWNMIIGQLQIFFEDRLDGAF